MAATKRKARVTRGQRFFYIVLKALFDVEECNLAARRHDIADDTSTQIQRVHQQIAAEGRDLFGFFALIQNQAQLFLAVGQFRRSHSFNSEQTNKKKIGRFVQQPDGRPEKEIKSAERSRQCQGDGEGISNGNVLWCELAKDDMQKSDSDEG